ncbi:MAG: hypothetical protein GX804_08280 [Lentisphaerae bacterium]|nr:hypothetical protein [Lentisphaerota bacterium]
MAIVFQGAIIKAISLPIQQRFGYSWINADLMSFYKTAGFIGLSFFLFICKLNIIRMAMCWRFGVKSRSNVVESLNTATAPLSLLPLKYSAVLTFVTMFAIVNGMMFFYKTSSLQIQTDSFTALVKWFPTTLKLALLAIADVLVLMRTLIIAVFIVQIAGMIMSNRTITGMAGEWFSEISRLFLNRPFVVGGIINLTPLIALFVLDFAHKILIGFISGLF